MKMFYVILFLFLAARSQAEKVKIQVYYETLCPDSIVFIRDQLKPAYEKLYSIMKVELYAYGKATDVATDTGYTFDCQHGDKEREGNGAMACAKKYITNADTFIRYTICVMTQPYPPTGGEHCASLQDIDWPPIQTCTSNPEGEILLHEEGLIQSSNNDEVNWIPRIVVNGEYSDANLAAAQDNLERLVCEYYTGEDDTICIR